MPVQGAKTLRTAQDAVESTNRILVVMRLDSAVAVENAGRHDWLSQDQCRMVQLARKPAPRGKSRKRACGEELFSARRGIPGAPAATPLHVEEAPLRHRAGDARRREGGYSS